MPFSSYWAAKVLDVTVRGVNLTAPAQIWMALYSSSPTPVDVGTEISGGSYARRQVTFSSLGFGSGQNSAKVTFGIASAPWGNVTHFGFRDASAAGNLIYYDEFPYPFNITIGKDVSFDIGRIILTVGG